MNESTKKGLLLAGVMTASLLYSEISAAALPAAATDAFTALTADIQALVAKAWDIVVPVTVAFVYMKFFKKAAKAA